MTWYEHETQAHGPTGIVRAFKKFSAGTRWIILVVLVGRGLAALVGIAAGLGWAVLRSNL